jgi:hypothetical protein
MFLIFLRTLSLFKSSFKKLAAGSQWQMKHVLYYSTYITSTDATQYLQFPLNFHSSLYYTVQYLHTVYVLYIDPFKEY